MVAAAGNDSNSSTHYAADFPAVLCGVVAVAATQSPAGANWKTGSGTTLVNASNGPYYSTNVGAPQCLNGDNTPRPARPAYALGSNVCSIDWDAPQGMGLWSGTSFAAALTSGNLASVVEQGGTAPYDTAMAFSEDQPCG
jgi:hypothetical protein